MFVSLSLAAQVGSPRSDFSVGVSGGYTLNTVSFSPAVKQNMKGSPSFGFATRYICEKYFNSICAVQAEVNYHNLGWSDFFENEPENKYIKSLYNINIPIMMQMGWGKERKGFKFLFEAGPYLDYYLGSSVFERGTPWQDRPHANGVTHQYEYDIDNKITYGICAGLGLEHSSVIGHFMLEARYGYGLGDMYDNSKKGFFGRSANSTIEVKLTYLFDIIKTKMDK